MTSNPPSSQKMKHPLPGVEFGVLASIVIGIALSKVGSFVRRPWATPISFFCFFSLFVSLSPGVLCTTDESVSLFYVELPELGMRPVRPLFFSPSSTTTTQTTTNLDAATQCPNTAADQFVRCAIAMLPVCDDRDFPRRDSVAVLAPAPLALSDVEVQSVSLALLAAAPLQSMPTASVVRPLPPLSTAPMSLLATPLPSIAPTRPLPSPGAPSLSVALAIENSPPLLQLLNAVDNPSPLLAVAPPLLGAVEQTPPLLATAPPLGDAKTPTLEASPPPLPHPVVESSPVPVSAAAKCYLELVKARQDSFVVTPVWVTPVPKLAVAAPSTSAPTPATFSPPPLTLMPAHVPSVAEKPRDRVALSSADKGLPVLTTYQCANVFRFEYEPTPVTVSNVDAQEDPASAIAPINTLTQCANVNRFDQEAPTPVIATLDTRAQCANFLHFEYASSSIDDAPVPSAPSTECPLALHFEYASSTLNDAPVPSAPPTECSERRSTTCLELVDDPEGETDARPVVNAKVEPTTAASVVPDEVSEEPKFPPLKESVEGALLSHLLPNTRVDPNFANSPDLPKPDRRTSFQRIGAIKRLMYPLLRTSILTPIIRPTIVFPAPNTMPMPYYPWDEIRLPAPMREHRLLREPHAPCPPIKDIPGVQSQTDHFDLWPVIFYNRGIGDILAFNTTEVAAPMDYNLETTVASAEVNFEHEKCDIDGEDAEDAAEIRSTIETECALRASNETEHSSVASTLEALSTLIRVAAVFVTLTYVVLIRRERTALLARARAAERALFFHVLKARQSGARSVRARTRNIYKRLQVAARKADLDLVLKIPTSRRGATRAARRPRPLSARRSVAASANLECSSKSVRPVSARQTSRKSVAVIASKAPLLCVPASRLTDNCVSL